MASSSPIPKNGAVVYGTLVADYNAFDIDASQMVEDVTPYGVNVCAKNVGNGTNTFAISIQAYALAHASLTPPGFGTAPSGAGVSTTLTIDTGVSEAMTVVQASFRISTGRMRAAVPYNISGRNGGDVSETWATS